MEMQNEFVELIEHKSRDYSKNPKPTYHEAKPYGWKPTNNISFVSSTNPAPNKIC